MTSKKFPDAFYYQGAFIGAEIHGSIGDKTYYLRGYRKQAKTDKYSPTNRETAYQQTWRYIVKHAIDAWNAFSEEEKEFWKAKLRARRSKKHYPGGFQLYLSYTLKQYRTRTFFQVGTSQIGTDYIMYGRHITIGTSVVGSGDKIS